MMRLHALLLGAIMLTPLGMTPRPHPSAAATSAASTAAMNAISYDDECHWCLDWGAYPSLTHNFYDMTHYCSGGGGCNMCDVPGCHLNQLSGSCNDNHMMTYLEDVDELRSDIEANDLRAARKLLKRAPKGYFVSRERLAVQLLDCQGYVRGQFHISKSAADALAH